MQSSTFGDLTYEQYYYYGGTAQSACFTLCLFLCFALRTSRSRDVLLLLAGYEFYSLICDTLFGDITATQNTLEVMFFLSWSILLMTRVELKTKAINKDNILLGFYRGEKGSLIMNLFSLVGLNVKSMCIIAGDNCLRLKQSRDTFQLTNSGDYFATDDDYYVVDTGVKYDNAFVAKMRDCVNMKATKGLFRIRCIEAVEELLASIGEEWRPIGLLEKSPSLYLTKVLRL